VDPNSTANSIDVLGNDNVAPPKMLVITAVTQGANGSVAIAGDGKSVIYSPNAGFIGRDAFTYTIDDGNGGVDTGTATVRVNSRPSLAVSDASAMEGNSGTAPAVFTVTLSSAIEGPVTFDYTTVDKTAIAGTDYVLASGTLVLAPGQTTATIPVQVIGNTTYQGNRNFTLKLSNIIDKTAVIFGGIGKGTIVDDEPKPTIAISAPSSASEGAPVTFTVTLTGATTVPATVNYTTVDGTALAGSDYTAASGVLTFAPGETTKTFDVQVLRDTVAEAAETFKVRLSAPTNAALGTANVASVSIQP
jgi:chitinase